MELGPVLGPANRAKLSLKCTAQALCTLTKSRRTPFDAGRKKLWLNWRVGLSF